MLDLKMMIAIGGGLLMVIVVLTGVVICLYYKLAKELK